MPAVKVSNSYRIVIPREVREELGIRRGQVVTVIAVDGVMEVVPEGDLGAFEGAYPQISLDDVREEAG